MDQVFCASKYVLQNFYDLDGLSHVNCLKGVQAQEITSWGAFFNIMFLASLGVLTIVSE